MAKAKSGSAALAERARQQTEARKRLLADLGVDDITDREREAVRSEWHAPRSPRARRRAKARTVKA